MPNKWVKHAIDHYTPGSPDIKQAALAIPHNLIYACVLKYLSSTNMSNKSNNSTFVIQNALLASRLSKKVGGQLSAHGISLTEYLVMHYLYGSPHNAVPRIDLAEHLGMSASGVTRLIAPLDKNNIIEKVTNPRDARQSLVKLSKTGQRIYKEASVSFEHITKDLVGHLSQSQQEKLIELFRKVI